MLISAPSQQLLVGIPASLTATLTGADGEPMAALTATVTVTRANGTVLYTNAATTDNGDGTYSLALSGSDLSLLDLLVAQWTVSGNVRATTAHEVVGGFFFTQADVNIAEQGRAATDGESFATLRAEVEAEAERICGVAFVPRYRRIVLDGANLRTMMLPDPMVRGGTIRSLTFRYTSTSSYTLTAPELAAISVNYDGIVGYLNSQDVFIGLHTAGRFPSGFQNVVVEYEHGYDRPPADLKRAAMRRFRSRSNKAKSGIPDQAISYTAQNGATYRIATADTFSTGDPDIDAVYQAYAWTTNQLGFA